MLPWSLRSYNSGKAVISVDCERHSSRLKTMDYEIRVRVVMLCLILPFLAVQIFSIYKEQQLNILPTSTLDQERLGFRSHSAREGVDDWMTGSAPDWGAEQGARRAFLARSCRVLVGRRSPLGAVIATKEFTRRLQHLLVDDDHQAIYCYVPKVACTNWKRIWMILTNKTRALSPSEIPSHVPHVSRSLRSLADSSFSSDDVRVRLSRYTKFLFVRHPMERLVSAFRNKFEKETQFSRSIGPEILRKFRKHHSGTPHANVTFSEFVRYLVDKKFRRKESLNEHWEAYTELCLPCIVPYDYIGKYETLKEDSDRILEEIGAPEGLQFPPFVPSATASLVPRYLSTLLPSEQRLATDVYKADFLLFQYDFPIVRNKSIS